MKKSKGFWLLIGSIVLSIAFVGYLFFGSGMSPVKVVSDGKDQLVKFTGADLHEMKDGKLLWSLKAESILYNPRTKEVFLENMKGEFHDGGNTFIVNAKKGHVSENQEVITMTGEVYGKTEGGVEFKGIDLVYNTKTKKMTSSKPFTYKDGHSTITGDTLNGDMVLKEVTAKGHVKLVQE